jgi:hypothetical protein
MHSVPVEQMRPTAQRKEVYQLQVGALTTAQWQQMQRQFQIRFRSNNIMG